MCSTDEFTSLAEERLLSPSIEFKLGINTNSEIMLWFFCLAFLWADLSHTIWWIFSEYLCIAFRWTLCSNIVPYQEERWKSSTSLKWWRLFKQACTCWPLLLLHAKQPFVFPVKCQLKPCFILRTPCIDKIKTASFAGFVRGAQYLVTVYWSNAFCENQ